MLLLYFPTEAKSPGHPAEPAKAPLNVAATAFTKAIEIRSSEEPTTPRDALMLSR